MNHKIDRRISYKLVLDTETCPIDRSLKDVVPSNMLVYDVGWAVVDKRGKVYETNSFVVFDIFYGEKEKMQSAHYANKIPLYVDRLDTGETELRRWWTIRKRLFDIIEKYNIKEVYAHNARFDYGSLNKTHCYIKNGYKYDYFPEGVNICDTLMMARDVIVPMPTYRKFCEANDFLTSRGTPRATAESLYAFISKNPNFEEEHTGLSDVMIEKEIMAYCYRQHKKMRKVYRSL